MDEIEIPLIQANDSFQLEVFKFPLRLFALLV